MYSSRIKITAFACACPGRKPGLDHKGLRSHLSSHACRDRCGMYVPHPTLLWRVTKFIYPSLGAASSVDEVLLAPQLFVGQQPEESGGFGSRWCACASACVVWLFRWPGQELLARPRRPRNVRPQSTPPSNSPIRSSRTGASRLATAAEAGSPYSLTFTMGQNACMCHA